MYRCSQGPEMGTEPSGTAVSGSCEPTDVGAANQTEVMWKSSKHSHHRAISPVPGLLGYLRMFPLLDSYKFENGSVIQGFNICSSL